MELILGADREHHLPRKMLALVYLQNLLHRVSHAQVMAAIQTSATPGSNETIELVEWTKMGIGEQLLERRIAVWKTRRRRLVRLCPSMTLVRLVKQWGQEGHLLSGSIRNTQQFDRTKVFFSL